jgi:hypothetical protein
MGWGGCVFCLLFLEHTLLEEQKVTAKYAKICPDIGPILFQK